MSVSSLLLFTSIELDKAVVPKCKHVVILISFSRRSGQWSVFLHLNVFAYSGEKLICAVYSQHWDKISTKTQSSDTLLQQNCSLMPG